MTSFSIGGSAGAAELRLGIHERTGADGRVLEAPTAAELTRLRDAVTSANPEAIAISFFLIRQSKKRNGSCGCAGGTGQAAFGVHKILPEFREYERTSTVVVNAYLQPLMQATWRRSASASGICRLFRSEETRGAKCAPHLRDAVEWWDRRPRLRRP